MSVSLRRLARVALVCAAFVLLLGIAATATNIVPSTRAGSSSTTPAANQLKPAACAALNLTAIASGGGSGNLNTLILGTPGNDTLVGAAGDDCIVGGAGNDRLIGNGGTDVCIGGPGIDILHVSCETRIQ